VHATASSNSRKILCGWKATLGLVPLIASAGVISSGCGSVSEPVMTDAGVADVPVDMSVPDIPVQVSGYDVAYVSEITLTPAISTVFSFLLIVNTGRDPLDTSTVQVVSYADDNPGVTWTFKKEADATKPLVHGAAAGALSLAAKAAIVDTGLADEAIADPFLNFSMSFASPPPAGLDVNAQVTLRIEGKDVMVPILIHVVASGDAMFNHAKRISSAR